MSMRIDHGDEDEPDQSPQSPQSPRPTTHGAGRGPLACELRGRGAQRKGVGGTEGAVSSNAKRPACQPA